MWEVHLPDEEDQILAKQLADLHGVDTVTSYDRRMFITSISATQSSKDSPAPRSDVKRDISTSNSPQAEDAVPPEVYGGRGVLIFVIGSGIDISHNEFAPRQILELYRPLEGAPPALRNSSYTVPQD